MEIREFREGDVLVLAPDGSLAGGEETSALETKLVAALKAGTRLLVMDCASVGQLTSAGIRSLLMTSRKLGRTQGRLVLCGMNPKVQKAFSISGFDKDFTVVATRDEALRRVLEPVKPVSSRPAKAAAQAPDVVETPAAAAAEAPPAAEPPAPAASAAVQPAAPASRPVASVQAAEPPPAVKAEPASPPAPDPRDAVATALLEALGVRVVPSAAARPGSVPPTDLDALASGVLAALHARAS
jgi:anti-anti-sigma factor